jgi:subtilisin family serine protease
MLSSIVRTRGTGIVAAAVIAALFAFPAQAAAPRQPNDVFYKEQWQLRFIGAPEAWTATLGLETVPVAVIDSGVDIDHPDLKDNIWRNPGETPGDGIDNDGNGYIDDVHGWDFVDDDNDPRPDTVKEYSMVGANHGTVTAGLIAARGDNGIGIAGVTWQTAIMPLRVLDGRGNGDTKRIVRAVDYAVRSGAKVINLGFVGGGYSEELKDALRRAYDAGVFIVAAAGNASESGSAADLDKNPLYPICLDRDADENFIYGVAATDDKDRKAPFSNYGAGCVDGSAPGTRIISTQLYRPGHPDFGKPYGGFYNGTSVSAPLVSGVAALMRSLDRNLTPKQITNILTETGVKVDDTNPEFFGKLGRVRIDAAKAVAAVAALRAPGPAPAATASLLPRDASGVVVAAPGPGRAPEVRMFTEQGIFVRGFLAFDAGFRGGVSVAGGNFDGTAAQSIVAAAGPGGGPHVRVFDVNTRAIGGFFAYDQRFRGGVNVAVGDVDGDGRDEIITGAGPGGGPHVRVFAPDGTPKGGFFAYDPRFRGGVRVSAMDLDGDGRAEIVTVPEIGSAASPRVWSAAGVRLADALYRRNDLLAVSGSDARLPPVVAVPARASSVRFFAFEPSFRGGVRAIRIPLSR